jgi:hypothetical protein
MCSVWLNVCSVIYYILHVLCQIKCFLSPIPDCSCAPSHWNFAVLYEIFSLRSVKLNVYCAVYNSPHVLHLIECLLPYIPHTLYTIPLCTLTDWMLALLCAILSTCSVWLNCCSPIYHIPYIPYPYVLWLTECLLCYVPYSPRAPSDWIVVILYTIVSVCFVWLNVFLLYSPCAVSDWYFALICHLFFLSSSWQAFFPIV